MKVDLRSDTVTKPTKEMLEAMVQAQLGDDVFAEDPTMNAFEQKMADFFGFESGLFVPSGTMGNQLALAVLSSPGDEVIVDELGHIFNYESAAASVLSGLQLRTLKGNSGKLNVKLAQQAVRTANDWDPLSRILALEQTTNKGGGAYYLKQELEELAAFAKEHELKLHIDGARIWNALHESDTVAADYGIWADTLSVCFSKGLGAPIGSMLLSSSLNIKRARRLRKMWGGGMRQVGLLAAAADYAFQHHYEGLKADHKRAKILAAALVEHPAFSIDLEKVFTNIVLFDLVDGKSASEWLQRFEEFAIFMVPFGPKTIRATFHHQVDDHQLEYVLTCLDKLRS
jgi:threonine aldolase